MGRKVSRRLSWPILDRRRMPKMAELGAQMGPRWRQDAPRWALSGGSWGRCLQKWPMYKNEHHYGVLATFSSLGGSGWRLLGLSWGILARSWAILGDLGVKLGPCWQHAGTTMAKMSQDRRTWVQKMNEVRWLRKLPWKLSGPIWAKRGKPKIESRWPKLGPRWLKMGLGWPS